MAKETVKDISKLSFEEAIKSLNEIVGKIEGGDVPLSSSIEQYERGMSLIKHCRGILQTAEKKIERISAQAGGQEEVEEIEEEEEQAGEELF